MYLGQNYQEVKWPEIDTVCTRGLGKIIKCVWCIYLHHVCLLQ